MAVIIIIAIVKVYIHIEKKYDDSIKQINSLREKLYKELSDNKPESELLSLKVHYIKNFLEENDTLGEKESRNKLFYRLNEVFQKKIFNKTELEFAIENIEHFYKTHDLPESYKTDAINSAKVEAQKYSIYADEVSEPDHTINNEDIPEHIRPILKKLKDDDELSISETMMLLEDSQRDDS